MFDLKQIISWLQVEHCQVVLHVGQYGSRKFLHVKDHLLYLKLSNFNCVVFCFSTIIINLLRTHKGFDWSSDNLE